MSYREWEPDVELIEYADERPDAFSEKKVIELPFSNFDVQDSLVTYNSTRERAISMRVMGFTATNPIVLAKIISEGGRESLRRGELIGSQHPKEGIVFPKVLRTHFLPIILEIGQGNGRLALPTPINKLHAQKPKHRLLNR